MRKTLTIATTLFLLSGCSNEELALSALQKAQYSSIEITGYSFFSCPPSEFVHTGFKARNTFGVEVNGVVCSSPFSDRPVILDSERD